MTSIIAQQQSPIKNYINTELPLPCTTTNELQLLVELQ